MIGNTFVRGEMVVAQDVFGSTIKLGKGFEAKGIRNAWGTPGPIMMLIKWKTNLGPRRCVTLKSEKNMSAPRCYRHGGTCALSGVAFNELRHAGMNNGVL